MGGRLSPLPPLDPATRARLANEALALIAQQRIALLVTFPPGEPFPRLRAMGFVHQSWQCYLSTRRTSRKVREIEANPLVTLLFCDQHRRRDHFIQLDSLAVAVNGAEFLAWQERRYQKEGEALRRATAGMTPADWAGWRLEPLRVRINGHLDAGPWRETPVVLTRADLGLPPLPATLAARLPARPRWNAPSPEAGEERSTECPPAAAPTEPSG
ncbi:MAG: hypothetical protein KatS3mg061_1391 [Dehalococcoidia bacterium]|nr:MAG: hypothetical protein KatS3mg061_1391 [Dehalococcoidia bacterium]